MIILKKDQERQKRIRFLEAIFNQWSGYLVFAKESLRKLFIVDFFLFLWQINRRKKKIFQSN